MSEPVNQENQVVPVKSPTGDAVLKMPPWLGAVLVILVTVAGTLPTIPGLTLPPVVIGICGIVVAIGAAVGIVSAGARK